MLGRRVFGQAATAAMLATTVTTPPAWGADEGDPASLDAVLRPYLASHGLPALAAAVVRNGRIAAAGAVGTRRVGTDSPVTLQDRFHIGSDTKAMTSLLAGMLVEAGKLRWDGTVAEAFPELEGRMATGLGGVTLRQLLSHTSGMPSDNDAFGRLIGQSLLQGGLNLNELRLWLVREWAAQPLEAPPGTRFAYSNMGYLIAGAMIERAAGTTWEELIVARVFEPLGLRTAGLGPQSTMGRVDAPLGHLLRGDGTLKPMLAGPDGDNPAILGPAGVVHLSILDFARWAGWNAGEGRRGPALVRPDTLRTLHAQVIEMPTRPDAAPGTPAKGGYALGWGIMGTPYSPEPFLTHNGSNQMNLACIMVQPARDWAMVLAMNVAGARADQAIPMMSEELYRQFGPGSG